MKRSLFIAAIVASMVSISSADINPDLDGVQIKSMLGSYSVDGDDVGQLSVGFDARKHFCVNDNVSVGPGVSVNVFDNDGIIGDDGQAVIGDAFVSADVQLTPAVSSDFALGYTGGDIDGHSMKGVMLGAAVDYAVAGQKGLTIGFDWKTTLNVNSDDIKKMDGDAFHRYNLTVGYKF